MNDPSPRGRAWAETNGVALGAIRLTRPEPAVSYGPLAGRAREERESIEDLALAPGATRARGAGDRLAPEAPDPWRTCFERDRDRIVAAHCFRRLSGKTQVFIAPVDDHIRTRMTHALEVARVAVGIAAALRLNVALAEAIALAHDCGHGPFGHASEDAFSPFVPGGYDHAVWGADVALAPLNLCAQTTDGVRNHSWNRPAPQTAEGLACGWADRIAYVCHDLEDAIRAGLVRPDELPRLVREVCGDSRQDQIRTFVASIVRAAMATGYIGMMEAEAEALAALRSFLYRRVYLRPESVAQREAVIPVLRGLVEYFAESTAARTDGQGGEVDPVTAAVTYVSGMTDRFAMRLAVERLGWDPMRIPLTAA